MFRPRRERTIKELASVKGGQATRARLGTGMKNDEGARATLVVVGTAVRMVISICKDYPDNRGNRYLYRSRRRGKRDEGGAEVTFEKRA